ncbi:polyprotein [Tieghemostelium lacteum]|uniref:RNA-directed DNA polymerase n=1 Tax=Tieghemostelium lacteum TaxID=361077 RepID=A0A151Z4Q0_TIELA|nr:polyprotein [Tieghemostelium lacteum]|eukprot:KYQ88897.1 polyprotein [Tieghemostelium lacteum]
MANNSDQFTKIPQYFASREQCTLRIEDVFSMMEVLKVTDNQNAFFHFFRGEALSFYLSFQNNNNNKLEYNDIKKMLIDTYKDVAIAPPEEMLKSLNYSNFATFADFLKEFIFVKNKCPKGITEDNFIDIFLKAIPSEIASVILNLDKAKKFDICYDEAKRLAAINAKIYSNQFYTTTVHSQISIEEINRNFSPTSPYKPIMKPMVSRVKAPINSPSFNTIHSDSNYSNVNNISNNNNNNYNTRSTITCVYCKKSGHSEDRCFNKFPHLKNGNNQYSSKNSKNNNKKKSINTIGGDQSNQIKDLSTKVDSIMEMLKMSKSGDSFSQDAIKNFANAANNINMVNEVTGNVISCAVSLEVNSVVTEVLIDSGAAVTVISKAFADKLLLKAKITDKNLTAANGQKIKVLGTVNLFIKDGGNYNLLKEVIVCEDIKYNLIIGITEMKILFSNLNLLNNTITTKSGKSLEIHINKMINSKSGIDVVEVVEKDDYLDIYSEIVENYTINHIAVTPQLDSMDEFIMKYPEPFKTEFKAGQLKGGYHHIKLTEGPSIKASPYTTTLLEKKIIHEHTIDYINQGIWEKSNSSFSSPILIVKKNENAPSLKLNDPNLDITKMKEQYRIVGNFIKLNKRTIKDNYPVPQFEDVLVSLSKAKIFSKVDFKNGYFQIKVWPEDVDKTAICTFEGLYNHLVMAMGLVNAMATFMRLIFDIFQDFIFKWMWPFVDDIILFSTDLEEHKKHLHLFLQKVTERNMYLNTKKCQWMVDEIIFLGHLISAEGIRIDPSRFKALQVIRIPKNIKHLQQLLGLINYYRKFIKNLSIRLIPIYKLLKKGEVFQWNVELQTIIDNIINDIINHCSLKLPDPSKPFELHTDASMKGMGAVLYQDKKIVAFFSKTYSSSESNWSASEFECYAVILALKHFHHLIACTSITIESDNLALESLKTGNIKNKRLAKWSMEIAAYDYHIKHREGRKNVVPDVLSRVSHELNVISTKEQQKDQKIKKKIESTVEEIEENIMELLVKELKEENEWSDLIKYLKNGVLPDDIDKAKKLVSESVYYHLHNDVLFRIVRHLQAHFQSIESATFLVVIPKSFLPTVFNHFHNDLVNNAHFGFLKTFHKIYDRFYMSNLHREVEQMVASCDSCQRVKSAISKAQSYNLRPIIPDGPMDIVGIDFMGPIRTISGMKYILILSCLFTCGFKICCNYTFN